MWITSKVNANSSFGITFSQNEVIWIDKNHVNVSATLTAWHISDFHPVKTYSEHKCRSLIGTMHKD